MSISVESEPPPTSGTFPATPNSGDPTGNDGSNCAKICCAALGYLHNGQPHDYVPDFIIRLKTAPVIHLILETKGFDDVAEAAGRWVL
jgi:hypothetical protein